MIKRITNPLYLDSTLQMSNSEINIKPLTKSKEMIKQILFTILILTQVSTAFGQTNCKIVNPKITQESYNNLLSDITKRNIKPERIVIHSDKYGNITAVESKQDELKGLLLKITLVPYLSENNILCEVNSTLNIDKDKIAEFKIISLQNDAIAGQLYTAVQLANLMQSQNCDKAISLFSKRQRENLENLKSNKENFSYWCSAWALPPSRLDRYMKRIIEGKGNFIFEDSQWKIDEK